MESSDTPFNPIIDTISDIQKHFAQGTRTSSSLVHACRKQIADRNGYLHAVIFISPKASQYAEQLDKEREAGRSRGPLHGIPILLKDNIATEASLGMDTTSGSFALAGSRPRANADVAERLIQAGAIILGKTNMTEWYRAQTVAGGWSAVGGQTQSAVTSQAFDPFDESTACANTSGSSSGSAVSASAGFAPAAIGTETVGSLIMPADRAGLFTIKPTIGIVSQNGIVPISKLCDSAGPMAKSASDVALLMEVLVDRERTEVPGGAYLSAADGEWGELKIGIVDTETWLSHRGQSDVEMEIRAQVIQEIDVALKSLKHRVKKLERASLPSIPELIEHGTMDISDCFDHDIKALIHRYLASVDNAKVTTLEDFIAFNNLHADVELPPGYASQEGLIRAAKCTMTDTEYDTIVTHARHAGGPLGIDKCLLENDIDVIIGPADGPLCEVSAAAGYPIATLPLGRLKHNNRPFGCVALASAHQEALLIKVMSAWEATFGSRKSSSPIKQPAQSSNLRTLHIA